MKHLLLKLNYFLIFLILISSMKICSAQSGLVGCYPLDNNANDFSGNHYDGTSLNLSPVADRFGTPNSAYHFTGINSSVDLPFTGFLLDTFTYSVWCKPTSLPGLGHYYSILSIGGSVADQALLLANDTLNGNVGFGAASWDSNIVPHDCNSDTLPASNQWYHVVMTRMNSLLNLYIDGSLVCSTITTNITAGYLNVITASIGTRAGTPGQNFVGDIDDVRIFNRALSLTEIQNMSASCQPIISLCLIACYPLNNDATDQSGNDYNGTTNNVTTTSDHLGNLNSAFDFTGTNSYITLPSSDFLLDTFTYSVWCKPTSLPSTGNYYSILSIGGGLADQAILIGNAAVSGNVGFGTASWASNITPHSCSTGALPVINQWYHLVITRTNTTSNLYVNDTLICSATIPNLSAGYQSTVSALIGSRASTSGQNFVGDIDDVRIYNCALSLSQIKDIGASCFSTAIYELSSNLNSIKIYPNPATTSFTLQLKKDFQNIEVSICDLLGKEQMRKIFSGTEIELQRGSLKSGIYFVKVLDPEGLFIQKLIIQ